MVLRIKKVEGQLESVNKIEACCVDREFGTENRVCGREEKRRSTKISFG
jgi:hypothetical protein